MNTAPLKNFATWARRELITQVSARLTAVLAPASPERVENQRAVSILERDIASAGGGARGKDAITDRVAYTWFNRIIALRFMDANGYTGIGVVSPAHGQQTGQPEILADAKRGSIDPAVVSNKRTLETITGLLDGTRPSADAQGEAYTLLLAEYCRYWHRSMPFMFEREGDYTELLIPANLLAADSILTKAAAALTEEICYDGGDGAGGVEVIGWLYQFYISERKDEVFAGFKKGKKAGAVEIPAATQLFTPHWIVRYLVENSLGRLWMLNHPSSRLVEQMDYYIAPVDEETDFLRIGSPEELKIMDPACGSGHMLTYAFDLLYAIYEEEGYAPSEIPGLILTHNLYGTEIDPRAGALAAFALTMKARARQRTFFGKQVQPNICVLYPISFAPDEIEFLLTPSGNKRRESTFLNRFEHADTCGSLIQPDLGSTVRLKQHIAQLDKGGDILLVDVLNRAERVIEQAEYLSPQYAVVVANPPYMGMKSMDGFLSKFAKLEYKDAKSDLFAMFIERCLALALDHGLVGMITMQSWMFLSSFESLRLRVLLTSPPAVMAHLGERAFDSIGGSVVSTTAFVLARGRTQRLPATYFRVIDGVSEAAKAAAVRNCLSDPTQDLVFAVAAEAFGALPGSPVAYWLSDRVRAAFALGRPLREVAEPRQGLATTNNGRFTRWWWEIPRMEIGLGLSRSQAAASTLRWFPYNKGGEYRKWYGNQGLVVNWQHDGREIKDEIAKKYLYLNGNVDWVAKNQDTYFLPSVSWSKISSGEPAFRVYPPGFVYDVAGTSIFAGTENARGVLASFANSSVSLEMLRALAPTLNYEVGQIAQLPIVAMDDEYVGEIIGDLVSTARSDWDSFETSWDFSAPPWLGLPPVPAQTRSPGGVTFRENVAAWSREWAEYARGQQARETQNNRVIASAYGLDGEVPIDVPLHRVSLIRNVYFRYGPGDNADDYAALERADLAADLVSYAVGCMFGRYSLDEPGLILADQGATVQDYLAKVPAPTFTPDSDNVLPIVDGDWFEDDIVARFRQFLRVAFGEQHFEENLRFVEESLGVKSLREYFITRAGRSNFYDDHVKRYKRRPIYWLFSSPKGSFNGLIYLHRYTPSTVSTVLNEYLREFESKLEANLQHQNRVAAGGGTPPERAAALKEAERLRKMLVELGEYEHDVLYPLASQQIAIDLDDGVKANYPKFYPALRKITGLEASNE